MATTQAQKPKYERGRTRGEVIYIGAEIEPAIAKAVDQYVDQFGSSKRFMIENGLKLFLQEKGFWPPQDD
jgi:hypothetical protein